MGWVYEPPERHKCLLPVNHGKPAGSRWSCDTCSVIWMWDGFSWDWLVAQQRLVETRVIGPGWRAESGPHYAEGGVV